jgi:CBS domain-containing protein
MFLKRKENAMQKSQTVLESKRYGIYLCQPTASLQQVALRMAEEDISALVVVDEQGFLEGIIARMDLLRAYLTHQDWQLLPVEKYMNRAVVTVKPEDDLGLVAKLMLEKQIHRVVVVQEENERQKPVAVVSAADLISHMANSAEAQESTYDEADDETEIS